MPPQNPATNPLGPPTVNGTLVTVDDYLNPPTRIPAIVRNLVAANQGYFIERVFATPGFTVEGGAIIYEETFPEDHFLPAGQSIAPRAPGSEAPLLGSTRHAPKVAQPESWSGSIEVHDEQRRRNNAIAVRRQFTQAANTFADRLQTRGMAVLASAVSTWGRQLAADTAGSGGWRQPRTDGVPNADPFTMPQADIELVMNQFVTDKAGVLPDTMIVNPADAYYLALLYPEGKLKALLDQYGLTLIKSVAAPVGAPYFLKAGQVGVMAFEKPLDQELTREGKRKTDVFTLESVPVFVANDASAILQLTGVDDDGS